MPRSFDPLAVYREALPPPPRAVPPEVETLLDEMVQWTRRQVCLPALLLTLWAACYLPEAWRWVILDLRGRRTVATVRSEPRQVLLFPLRRRVELHLQYLDPTWHGVGTTVVLDPGQARAMRVGTTVPITADPLGPGRVRLEGAGVRGWPLGPFLPLGLLLSGALSLPLLAGGWGRARAARRRQAYRWGVPVSARIQESTRSMAGPHLRLTLELGCGSRTYLEPVAPAEVDRYPPLSDALVLLHQEPDGALATCTLGPL
jgi:hypothetical protein